VAASQCHPKESHPQLAIDFSRCERPNLEQPDILLLADQILKALPKHSDPSPMILSATCLPREKTSHEVAPGETIQLPDAAVWLLIAQGFHEKRALPMPKHPRAPGASPPRIDRIRGAPKPQKTWSLGYYLAYDHDAQAAGFGAFGPPATILEEE
jgi:hypothetical protein